MDLEECQLNDAKIKPLLEEIRLGENIKLKSLNIAKNKLTATSGVNISEMVGKNPHL